MKKDLPVSLTKTERYKKEIKRYRVIFAVGIVISVLSLVWVFSKIDLVLLMRTFKQIRFWWLIPMVLVYLANFIIRGLRWRIMLYPLKPISWRSASEVIVIGYMANNILPARLGEFVRAYVVGKKEGLSKAGALGSIAVERIFDGLVLVGIFAIMGLVSPFEPNSMDIIRNVGISAAFIFCIALSLVLIARLRRSWIETLTTAITKNLSQKLSQNVKSVVSNILDAVLFLRVDKTLPLFLLLSILVWMIEGSIFWMGLAAFNLDPDPRIAYFTLGFVNLGLLVPSAPAYVGIFQSCNALAFSFFDLSKNVALAYSITIHALMVVPITILGLFFINFYGMSLWRFRKAKVKEI